MVEGGAGAEAGEGEDDDSLTTNTVAVFEVYSRDRWAEKPSASSRHPLIISWISTLCTINNT